MKTSINTLFKILLLSSFTLVCVSGCKRDDDDPEDPHDHNESELITTVELGMEDQSTNVALMYRWRDVDGPGGDQPMLDTIFLDTSSVYSVTISFLDESGEEVEDITAEIQAEAEDHIICYASDGPSLDVQSTDTDGTFSIGLTTLWTTSHSSSGNVLITLKHQPGIKDGTCTPGETDVEISLPFVIE